MTHELLTASTNATRRWETLTAQNQMMVMLMAPMKEDSLDSLMEEHGKEGTPKEEPLKKKPVPPPSKPGRQC